MFRIAKASGKGALMDYRGHFLDRGAGRFVSVRCPHGGLVGLADDLPHARRVVDRALADGGVVESGGWLRARLSRHRMLRA